MEFKTVEDGCSGISCYSKCITTRVKFGIDKRVWIRYKGQGSNPKSPALLWNMVQKTCGSYECKFCQMEVLMVRSMKVWPRICPIPAPGVCLRTYDTPRSSSQNSRTHWRFLLNGLHGSGPWRISQGLLVC